MKKIFLLSAWSILIALTGCKTNTQLLKCPNISMVKGHHETMAKRRQHSEHNTANNQVKDNNGLVTSKKTEGMASIANDEIPLQIKLPRLITRKLDNDEIQNTNEIFAKYSGGKVRLEKNDKGKIYFKANSKQDFFKLATTLATVKKTEAPALPGGGGGLAVAGGILGIIAIVLALGPYVSYGAFLLGLLAIIFGAIGLPARPGWGVTAIVLGALAIIFSAVLGVFVYTIVLHI